MADYETITFDVARSVASISLNRPDSLNAFNQEMRLELCRAVQFASADDEVKVIVLRGEGRAFCAGADLREKYPDGQTAGSRLNSEYKPFLMAIHDSRKPVIASVQGAAAGIGSALALVCDLIVMEEGAYFYQAFAAIGLVPDGGATWQLTRALGPRLAYEVMMTGEKLSAERCLELQLINRVAAAGTLHDVTGALADTISKKAPLSARYTKQAVRDGMTLDFAEAISMEAKLQTLASASDDHQEGKAAFLEKRLAHWRGQ